MAQEKLLSQSNRNLSKAQIEARQKAEATVVTNVTAPKPNATVKNNRPMRLMFNKMKKLNSHFTEADSIALNTLIFNLYLKEQNEDELAKLHILHDNYERFMLRIEKFNKQINESMKQLCIPLNARLSLANDMAKVMIEEQKLEQMKAQNAPTVNPLLAILEDDDDE